MLTVVSLAVSASAALSDQGTGGSFDSASYGSYAYGWKSGKDLIWLMDVYVAKTEDGLIDTSKYSVTSAIDTSNIEYMGTMLYTNGFSGNCIMPTKSYISERISAISTTPVSVAIDPYHTVMQYKLPQTTASDNFSAPFLNSKSESFTYVTKFGERQTYIFNSEPHGLPTTISSSYNYSMTKDVIESDQFTADIVKDLKHCVGEQNLNIAIKQANASVWNKVNGIAQDLYKKGSSKEDAQNDAIERLYPDSSKPLVQWAVVATPLALNTANAGTDIGFWITKDNTTDANSPSLEVATVQQHGSITYAMDAYTQSWYNSLTNEMLSNAKYREAISDKYGIPLTYLEKGSGTLAVNSSYPAQDKTHADWGLLRKEYGGDNYNKLADTAYIDSAKWPDHCLGIYSPKNYNNVDWHSGRDTYAKFGGITIAFSKMDEPQDIPVYYYITPTPNDPVQTTPTTVICPQD